MSAVEFTIKFTKKQLDKIEAEIAEYVTEFIDEEIRETIDAVIAKDKAWHAKIQEAVAAVLDDPVALRQIASSSVKERFR